MELTILGSGTCVPTLERSAPAVYLRVAGKEVLVDCGEGTMHQLIKARLSYKNIDVIFVTHTHPDHISGIMPFIHATNWTPGFDRKKELTIVGPKGFKKYYSTHILCMAGMKPRPYTIKVKEINKRMVFDEFLIEAEKTLHSASSIAYKFRKDKKSVVVSGDADYDLSLVRFCRKADLLILECSFPDSDYGTFRMRQNCPAGKGKKAGPDTHLSCGQRTAKSNRGKEIFQKYLCSTRPDEDISVARQDGGNNEDTHDWEIH
ncbi:MAG: ribonuclease Z [Candidatus Woesearchaeota archaeon]